MFIRNLKEHIQLFLPRKVLYEKKKVDNMVKIYISAITPPPPFSCGTTCEYNQVFGRPKQGIILLIKLLVMKLLLTAIFCFGFCCLFYLFVSVALRLVYLMKEKCNIYGSL